MAERVVTIKLLAEATGLVQGFNRAKDAVAETKAKVEESAKSNREEWAKVGTTLTGVGVAITGVGAAALKTGIQYNTLQQTTRAALTSLLGSAQAANAQMDKLDAFAKNSPFSKATFITAQQQMLAFGIETKKVIPYLNGVQNAVAAAGGSNADIEGIVATMSKIQSSAKITATDLMEFGNRGVNAADLIGSQMGKTGAQIREDITAGTLSAEAALDALAAGMNETYAGAADNVKNTFVGAMDRVKAAWRDFSAELATPLVDPNGGGALVDLLNWAADAMRSFEALPGPVKNTVSALTGLVGVGALVAGTFMLALPRILEFNTALKTLGVTGGGVRAGMGSLLRFLGGPWGVALLAATASVAIFNAAMDGSKVSAQQLEVSLKQGKSALDEMSATARQNEQGLTRLFVNVGQHIDDMPALLDKAATAGRGFWSSMSFNENAALDNIAEFGTVLANLATTDLPQAQAAFKAFYDENKLNGTQALTAINEEMPGFKNALLDAAQAAGLATDDSTLLKIALGELSTETRNSGDEYQAAADKASELTNKVLGLLDAISELNGLGQSAEQTNAKLQESFSKLQEYVSEAQAGVEGYSRSLDASTVEGSKNRAMLADHAADVEKNARAQFDLESKTLGATQAAKNFEQRLSNGRQQIYDTALALTGSADEAQKLTDKILGMPDQKDIDVLLRGAAEAETALNNLARYRETTIGVRYSDPGINYGSGQMTKAYGGTIGYAGGGTIGGIGGGISNGTVFGRGGTKSDSILVRLSRGEEVIQEPYASMYRRELKAMNRGDFAPSSMSAQQVVVVREVGDVYVQNPFTGQYLLSQVDQIANDAIDTSIQQQAQANRRVGL